MKKSIFLYISILILLFANSEIYSQNTAKLKGKVSEKLLEINNIGPLNPGSPKAEIILKSYSNLSIIQIVNLKKDKTFEFLDVPYATYIIELKAGENVIKTDVVNVNSKFNRTIVLEATNIQNGQVVEVMGDLEDKFQSGGKTYYNQQDIEAMPQFSATKAIETIILNTAGAVPDEDGRMHVRGEDAQLQYNIDGIPVTANQTRIYSSLFNSGVIKSMDFLRGGLNAEYGVATAGVLNINTKSGFDRPYFAHAFSQGGSFNSNDQGIEVGGNIDQKAALFAAYSSNFTGRYLDPISDGGSIHNNGKNQNLFVKGDVLLFDNIDLVMLGSYGKSNFGIPVFESNSKQDQKQDITNAMLGFRINANTSENSMLSFLGYLRNDEAKITSNGLNQIITTADSITALQNDKFFMGGTRQRKTYGGTIELNYKNLIAEQDNFKAGMGAEISPLSEYFSFAITNPALSNPESSGGDIRYKPYDITQGGKPFLVNRSMDASRAFLYALDNFQMGSYNVAVGVRYDMYKLFETENNISFRLGVNRRINNDLVLRASYNGVAMQAPLENILVSSSQEARQLTGAEQAGISNNVRSEKAHILEIGAAYKLNEYLSFDLAGYGKYINDFIVKVELGNSGVIFPVNLKNGIVAGGELQIRLNNWHNFSGFLNFSTCVSLGLIPSDGSTPIAAGLILGEEGQNYSHPFKGEDAFPTEHNQLMTASFNLTYSYDYGMAFTLGGRFDSGLPFDLVDKNGVGLDPIQSRLELKRRGYSDKVIDLLSLESEKPGSPDKSVAPHAIFDFAFSLDMRKSLSIPLKLSATVMNILDSNFLYKFESSFGGTHFGTPRMFSLRADLFTM